LPFIFDFAAEYAVRRAQENQEGLKFIDTYQLLVHAAGDKLFGKRIPTLRKSTGA
jgi:hypothetical protein